MTAAHSERKHSKFSASGADRWENCPGSVALSEGLPDKDSIWSIEGTEAHEVLEATLLRDINLKKIPDELRRRPREMFSYAEEAAAFIIDQAVKAKAEVLVETRISLGLIHPEAFGTFDAAVIDHFGTLNVYDYKYGAGHAVSPVESMQMAFYAIGLAHKYHWNFKRIRMWIIQPRIKGYDGPVFWEVPTVELKTKWVERFRKAVARVEAEPDTYVEGSHCHWCKAKSICPLKTDNKLQKAKSIFTPVSPAKGITSGKSQKEESSYQEDETEEVLRSEADWREEAKARKGKTKKGQIDKALWEVVRAYGRAEDFF